MNVLKDTTNTKDYNSGGNTVLAKTKDNQNYIFSHLDDVYVNTGDKLVTNSPIGKIGNTGGAIGSNMDNHLHIQSIPVNITNADDVIASARNINKIVSDDDLGVNFYLAKIFSTFLLQFYFKSPKLLTAKYLSVVKPSAYSTPTSLPRS